MKYSVLALAALVAVHEAAPAASGVAAVCQVPQRNNASLFHIRSSRPAPAANPTAAMQQPFSEFAGGNGGKILGYTRLTASYVACDGGQRDLSEEQRDVLARFFLGKETHKTLSMTTRVSPLDVKATTTLARFDRLSGRKGEEWSTSMENDRILLPYFRVDRSSTIDLQSELLSTREYNSSFAAGSFEVVEKAAALISPSAILITEENRARFNDAANFVDSSVNGLLRVSISERLRETLTFEGATGERLLATITLVLPHANDAFPSPRNPERVIGQWQIKAEAIRPSMFGDPGTRDRLSRTQLSAASILNFLVADNKTMREALAGAASVAAARDALITAPRDAARARVLCRAVSAEADRLGLTPMDASAAAWAFLADMALPPEADNACRTGAGAVEYYPVI